MLRYSIKFLSFLVFFLYLFSSLADAQPSPIPMLDQTATQVLHALNQNKARLKDSSVIRNIVNRHLIPHVDLDLMAKFVLGREAWNKATAQQKNQFTREFTTLVINTYASAFSQYNNEKIVFLPIRGNYQTTKRVNVASKIIRQSGPDINVSYRVYYNNDWRIYDISVEGVSILTSFRNQFADELRRGSLENLIQKLATHNRKV